VWWLGPLKVSKCVTFLWLWYLLILLHIDHGLLHGREHLSLHYQNLLKGWWQVSSIVVLTVIVVVGAGHLKNMV
jgi:hypothetical protein